MHFTKNTCSILALFTILQVVSCQRTGDSISNHKVIAIKSVSDVYEDKETDEDSEDDSTFTKDTLPRLKPAIDSSEISINPFYKKSVVELIDGFYKRNWEYHSMNGSFLVAKDGQILYEKYEGYVDLKKRTMMTADTPLHIASIGKVITASVVLKLVEAKKLELDQMVNTILPEFPYPNISIRMLLNHRSGIKDYADFTSDSKRLWNKQKILMNKDVLDILATKKVTLEFRPNTKFTYCNTNYVILASVIEKITGKSFGAALQEMIFDPLDMKDTFVCDYEKDSEKVTPSYYANRRVFPSDYLDGTYGDKNIYSTARDLLKLDRARNAPNFLPPNLMSQVYKGYSHEKRGINNYGLGIRMKLPKVGEPYYYHNGRWHGCTSSYISLRKEQVTIIALSNKLTFKTYKVRNIAPFFGNYYYIKK